MADASCTDVQQEMLARVQSPSWKDPHNAGPRVLTWAVFPESVCLGKKWGWCREQCIRGTSGEALAVEGAERRHGAAFPETGQILHPRHARKLCTSSALCRSWSRKLMQVVQSRTYHLNGYGSSFGSKFDVCPSIPPGSLTSCTHCLSLPFPFLFSSLPLPSPHLLR